MWYSKACCRRSWRQGTLRERAECLSFCIQQKLLGGRAPRNLRSLSLGVVAKMLLFASRSVKAVKLPTNSGRRSLTLATRDVPSTWTVCTPFRTDIGVSNMTRSGERVILLPMTALMTASMQRAARSLARACVVLSQSGTPPGCDEKNLFLKRKRRKEVYMFPLYIAATAGAVAVLALIALMLIPRRHDRRKDDEH